MKNKEIKNSFIKIKFAVVPVIDSTIACIAYVRKLKDFKRKIS